MLTQKLKRHGSSTYVESSLVTHDLAIPLPTPLGSIKGANRTPELRLLLLAPSSVSDSNLSGILDRIHRFAALTGGQNLAIVFLLNPPIASTLVTVKDLTANYSNRATDINGVIAYARLHAALLPRQDIPHVPILPLATVEGLPELLKNHVDTISRNVQLLAPATTPFELLHLCTTEPPMDRQTAYFVTDCKESLRELATICALSLNSSGSHSDGSLLGASKASGLNRDGSSDSQGIGYDLRAMDHLRTLRDLVGDDRCREIVDFFGREWVVE